MNARLQTCFPGVVLAFSLGLGSSLGACKGCGKKATLPPPTPQVESRHARLVSRMADLKVDRSKAYPKDASGVVTCKDDAVCFAVQAEACAKSMVRRRITVAGYGMNDMVDAVYEITGTEAGRCRLTRRVQSADVHIDQALVAAMRKEGHDETEIAAMQTEAASKLRRRYPPVVDCWFSSDDVLEVALDLADGLSNDRLFDEECHQVDGELEDPEPEPAPDEPPAPAAKPTTEKE